MKEKISDKIKLQIISGYKEGLRAIDLEKKIKVISKCQIAAIKAHHTMGRYEYLEVNHATEKE